MIHHTPALDVDAVLAALDRVVDPCSQAIGEPLGMREMGLVTAVDIDAGRGAVAVTMRLTSPCCAYGPALAEALRREVASLDGVGDVEVIVDHAAVWTPAAIETGAAARLDARRQRTIELSGARPHAWNRPEPRST